MEIPKKNGFKEQLKPIVFTLLVICILAWLIINWIGNAKAIVNFNTIPHESLELLVKKTVFESVVYGYGRLVPKTSKSLVSRVSGVIEELTLKPGSSVSPNSIVIKLANPDLYRELRTKELSYEEAKANHEQLKIELNNKQLLLENESLIFQAELDVANAEYTAKNSLKAKGIISEIELKKENMLLELKKLKFDLSKKNLISFHESMVSQLKASKIKLSKANQQIEIVEESIVSLNIKAGLNGKVTSLDRLVEIGRHINSGDYLGQVADQTQLYTELRVNAKEATNVTEGMSTRINIKGDIVLGVVNRISPSVENNQILIDIIITSSLPSGARPEMDVDAEILLKKHIGSLVIENNELINIPNNTYHVSVKKKHEESFNPTTISIGKINDKYIEILSKVDEGDTILLVKNKLKKVNNGKNY
jgi:HlyD family secretion protein